MSFVTSAPYNAALRPVSTEALGTVVTGDGELLQLFGVAADVTGRAIDVLVSGQHYEFRVPAYVLLDLGHDNWDAGFDALVDMLEQNDLSGPDPLASLPLGMAVA